MKHEADKKGRKKEYRIQKFCKKHKSIFGTGSWWCLFALWQERLDKCEVEYLEVEV